MKTNSTVQFEVVEIYYNDIYQPYTLKPTRKDSVKNYAIKIGNEYFFIGGENEGLHICDLEEK